MQKKPSVLAPACLEACGWARHTSKTCKPVGSRCKVCSHVWLSYPELAWDNYVAHYKASSGEFAMEVDKARSIVLQEERPDFRVQVVGEDTVLSYMIDKRYTIYTPAEFASKHGFPHTKLDPEIKKSMIDIVNAAGDAETVIAVDEQEGWTLTVRSSPPCRPACLRPMRTSVLCKVGLLRQCTLIPSRSECFNCVLLLCLSLSICPSGAPTSQKESPVADEQVRLAPLLTERVWNSQVLSE